MKKDDLEKIGKHLQKDNDVVAVYLYGSQSTGKTTKNSDIDVGVLYRNERDMDDRLDLIKDLNLLINDSEVDVNILDLNKSSVYLFNVIQGDVIFCRDTNRRLDFEVRVLKKYWDGEHLRNIDRQYLVDQYSDSK